MAVRSHWAVYSTFPFEQNVHETASRILRPAEAAEVLRDPILGRGTQLAQKFDF